MTARALLITTIAFCMLFPSLSTVEARTAPQFATITFRLQVRGHLTPSTTFWVAYGPVAGGFHIVQLHAQSGGRYVAQRTVPAHARTTLAYVSGTGTVLMAYGRAPGGPVITILSVGPAALKDLAGHTVQWYAPAG